MCFDGEGSVLGHASKAFDLIEQDRFTDASQPREQQALLRSPRFHSAKQDPSLFHDGVSPYEFWGRRARSRREWVFQGVHL